MTYFQTNRRSEDFVRLHSDYMLFNDPYKLSPEHTDRLKHNSEYGSELEVISGNGGQKMICSVMTLPILLL